MAETVTNKIIGYLLLVAGLFLIAYATLNVYDVFKGKTKPFEVFKFNAIALDFSRFVDQAPPTANLKQELVSSNLLNEPLNMVAHFLLMGFIASSGFKIASIGVMLVRTIKVKLKEEKENSTSTPPAKPSWK